MNMHTLSLDCYCVANEGLKRGGCRFGRCDFSDGGAAQGGSWGARLFRCGTRSRVCLLAAATFSAFPRFFSHGQ